MFRAILLYLAGADWARNIVSKWPVARRVVRRFVAGETLAEAIDVVREINQKGMTATVDVLGESITAPAQAREMTQAYIELMQAICDNGLDAWVSLKLTALGLDVDPELAHENVCEVLAFARDCGQDMQITIDMEDHTYTDRTLELFRHLREADGFQNVRTVIQAYLFRSEEDVAQLAEEGAGIRLCKGAYKEPASVAYPQKSDVDASYVRCMKALLDAASEGRGYPGIATHDEKIIDAARAYVAEKGISSEAFEFQMLYGVRSALQESLAAQGHGMRLYVPYGSQWYAYFMRRLAERPANVWFFVSNFFKR